MRATAMTTTAILWLSGIASIALLPIVNAADVTCQGGTFNANLFPKVTFTQHPSIQATAFGNNLGNCQSADLKITGGSFNFAGYGPGVCTGALSRGSTAGVDVFWNDGTKSSASQMNYYLELGTWSFNGVLKGRFEGKTIRATGRCTKPGSDIGLECIKGGFSQYPATMDSLVVG
ncbi:MAG: hypothetical protein J3Q66DRAFT_444764 [Benniella sp.]|nr:MAG: hypothetical protein J3Q66DRAFT_444764 [Benniella sp.]